MKWKQSITPHDKLKGKRGLGCTLEEVNLLIHGDRRINGWCTSSGLVGLSQPGRKGLGYPLVDALIHDGASAWVVEHDWRGSRPSFVA